MAAYFDADAKLSIHAPLTGGDKPKKGGIIMMRDFQSTPPSREATGGDGGYTAHIVLSIHAPLTGGDNTTGNGGGWIELSIHAPLTGGDGKHKWARTQREPFNPRPPHGRRPATA